MIPAHRTRYIAFNFWRAASNGDWPSHCRVLCARAIRIILSRFFCIWRLLNRKKSWIL